MGAVGAWNGERLRIPPFNPKKIVDELFFEKSGNSYVEIEAPKLHISQRSEFNHERRIERLGDSALFLWYSGETLLHPHGSVMVYTINSAGQSSWFVSFICKNTWRVSETLGISESAARALFEKTPIGV